jgi:hypothetical protein
VVDNVTLLKFELQSVHEHAGTRWFQLRIFSPEIYKWIETNSDDLWWENTPDWRDTNKFLLYTVHERLYTYISLKW